MSADFSKLRSLYFAAARVVMSGFGSKANICFCTAYVHFISDAYDDVFGFGPFLRGFHMQVEAIQEIEGLQIPLLEKSIQEDAA
jgi:hypothetical protein